MSTMTSIKAQIQTLLDSANAATGNTDTNLTDGVNALIGGYGTEPNLQDKTVTENGTITADEGYDGLSSVTVDVASSSGGGSVTFESSASAILPVYDSETAITTIDCSKIVFNDSATIILTE